MATLASEYLNTAEVAQLLRVDPETVRRWVREGRLPALRSPGQRHLLIRRDDIDRVMEPSR